MKNVLVLFLVVSFSQVGTAAEEVESVRFAHVDVYLDSKEKALAAYQLELDVRAGKVRIVGIEGGEHAAFSEPPYYDPAALAKDRVIIAAFNTGRKLPHGLTRVARIHVQITGQVQPRYEAKLTTAASRDGKEIPVEASTQEQGDTR